MTTLLRKIRLYVRDLLGGSAEDQSLRDEIGFHIEMETKELVAAGLDPAEAHRRAMIRFGGVDRFSEKAREARLGRALDTLARDFLYALRSFRRTPAFTLVAVLTIALGIGANTAIFSVVHAVLLKPLPYQTPSELLRIQTSWTGTPQAAISPAEFLDYRERLAETADLGVYVVGNVTLTGSGEPERFRAAFVSQGVLEALAVPPLRGRWFTAEEDNTDAPVALIDEGFWTRQLGADDAVVGQTLTVNGNPFQVVGIMPASFRMPDDLLSEQRTEFYLPLGITSATARGSHFLAGLARPGPGHTSADVAALLEATGRWMVQTFPEDYPTDMGFAVTSAPLAQSVRGPVRTPVLVLLATVGLVLLIACANVASLLIARAEARGQEFAIRAALGAPGRRLATQVVVESLVLAGLGGALGGLVALGLTPALAQASSRAIPWMGAVRPNASVLGFTALATLLTGLVFGAAPAFQAAGRAPIGALREGGRAGAGKAGRRLRSALVVGELAFALVLLAAAALLGRSFAGLLQVDPGYTTENIFTAELSLPSTAYPENADVVNLYRELEGRVRAVPGVEAAGLVTNLPLASQLGDLNFQIEGQATGSGEVSPRADWQAVTPGYMEAMGIRLLRGRAISPQDDGTAPGAVVISQTLAERYWPDRDPMGTRFELGGGAGPGWVTVVGVVADVRHSGLQQEPRGQMYLPHQQFLYWNGGGPARGLKLAVRSRLPEDELRGALAGAVATLDPTLPLARPRTMATIRSTSTAVPRVLTALPPPPSADWW